MGLGLLVGNGPEWLYKGYFKGLSWGSIPPSPTKNRGESAPWQSPQRGAVALLVRALGHIT